MQISLFKNIQISQTAFINKIDIYIINTDTCISNMNISEFIKYKHIYLKKTSVFKMQISLIQMKMSIIVIQIFICGNQI